MLVLGQKSGVFSAASATLFDAAEGEETEADEEKASDTGKNGDFGSLGEVFPAVFNTRRLNDFLHDGRGSTKKELVVFWRDGKDKLTQGP